MNSRAMAIRAWLGSNRSWLSPLLFFTALVAAVLAWYCTPPEEGQIRLLVCPASYVGPLEVEIGRQGVSGGTMGVGNGLECRNSGAYAVFSRVLNLSDQDLAEIRAAGSPYRLGLHAGAIVTIEGARRVVISYDDYVARATRMRNLCIAGAVAALLAMLGLLFLRGEKATSEGEPA